MQRRPIPGIRVVEDPPAAGDAPLRGIVEIVDPPAAGAAPPRGIVAATITKGAAPSEGGGAPRPASAAEVLEEAAACSRRGVRAVMATVVERHGSAPGTEGQKLLLAEDGTFTGTVGGGALERSVTNALRAALDD